MDPSRLTAVDVHTHVVASVTDPPGAGGEALAGVFRRLLGLPDAAGSEGV